ncbi:LOW QUALITY PROTEIN: hypothetical protein V2J09_022727 [Rumex salicifolius]
MKDQFFHLVGKSSKKDKKKYKTFLKGPKSQIQKENKKWDTSSKYVLKGRRSSIRKWYYSCVSYFQTKDYDLALFNFPSWSGEKFIPFIDDYSCYGYTYLLHEKSQSMNIVEVFINELDRKVKVLRSDRGVPKTSYEMWMGKIPRLRHLCDCPIEVRLYNLHEKKLDPRTVSGCFIGYSKKSKENVFYFSYHSTRIVEKGKAGFIEKGQISGSSELQKVDIKEIHFEVPSPISAPKLVVLIVASQSNMVDKPDII